MTKTKCPNELLAVGYNWWNQDNLSCFCLNFKQLLLRLQHFYSVMLHSIIMEQSLPC